jgi:hypothetical protein
MRDWGYVPSAEESALIGAAGDAFRTYWESIGPPFVAGFDGGVADVRALDYLDYEGLRYGPCTIEQAALVCGEALRRAAGLEWRISYRGEWMVTTREGAAVSFAFSPLARLHECECGAGPQFGRHQWVVEQGAVGCLLVVDAGFVDSVRGLVGGDGGYLGYLRRALGDVK